MATSAELHTEMGAYLHLLGYGRFDQKDENARQSALAKSYEQFRQQNGRQTKDMMVDDIKLMREQAAKSPEAIDRMRELAILPEGKKATPYDATVVQTGLAARNIPVAISGELNAFNIRQINRLSGVVPENTVAAAASTAGRAAFASASRYDPQAAEAQAYLRVLGYNGTDGKPNTGKIDGIKGPLTTAALEQFSKENKLPKDAPMSEVITALKAKALAGPGLARMEDIMGKPIIGTGVNQDVKAVQLALRSNGMNVPTTGRPDSNTQAALSVQRARLPAAQPAKPGAAASEAANEQPANEPVAEAAPDLTQPEIHVAPGGESAGIAASPGVIPTVVVGDVSAPQPASQQTVPDAVPPPSMAAITAPESTPSGGEGVGAPAAAVAPAAPAAAVQAAPESNYRPTSASTAATGERRGPVMSRSDDGAFQRAARPQRPEPSPIQQANATVRDVTRTINQTNATVNGFLRSISRMGR